MTFQLTVEIILNNVSRELSYYLMIQSEFHPPRFLTIADDHILSTNLCHLITIDGPSFANDMAIDDRHTFGGIIEPCQGLKF